MENILTKQFRKGDIVKFVEGFNRHDAVENPNYLPPLPRGFLGWIKEIENEYVTVVVLNPLAGNFFDVQVYSPTSTQTNKKEQRTDSLKITFREQKNPAGDIGNEEGFFWDKYDFRELFLSNVFKR